MKNLEGKIALITGCSKGIGKAVAKKYISEGAHVIAVARNTKKLEELDDYSKKFNSKITIAAFDLKDMVKIDELGYIVSKRFGKLDILVGNAAILGGLSPVAHFSPQSWEDTLNVNLNANWRLIRSFDPLLKQSSNGRAMFVTSGITKMNKPYWSAYAVSKIALEMLVKTYAAESATTNLKVNLIDPYIVATDLRAQAMPGEDPDKLAKPEDIINIFVELAKETCNINGKIVDINGAFR